MTEKLGRFMYAEKALDDQWYIHNTKTRDLLAEVIYYGRWRQHVLSPFRQTVFSADCLRDIAAFLERLDREKNTNP